jgi:hypothetical protein
VYVDHVGYNDLPWKYAAGTPNTLGVIVSAQALRLLVDLVGLGRPGATSGLINSCRPKSCSKPCRWSANTRVRSLRTRWTGCGESKGSSHTVCRRVRLAHRRLLSILRGGTRLRSPIRSIVPTLNLAPAVTAQCSPITTWASIHPRAAGSALPCTTPTTKSIPPLTPSSGSRRPREGIPLGVPACA